MKKKDYIINNRLLELACYRQFPAKFENLFGHPLEQYLAVYADKVDISSLSEEDINWIENNEEGNVFLHAFGYEAGEF